MSSLGARLKKARDKTKLTQQEVANRLGVSNGTISGYERNYRDPDTNTLAALANLYNTTTDYLTGKENLNTEEDTEMDKTRESIMEIVNSNDNLEELELTLEVIKKLLSDQKN